MTAPADRSLRLQSAGAGIILETGIHSSLEVAVAGPGRYLCPASDQAFQPP